MKFRHIGLTAWIACAAAGGAIAAQKPIVLDPAYSHDRWETQPRDVVREFRAFTVSFDGADDDDADGTPSLWRVPEWVAYEIKRFEGECIPTGSRPAWFSDDQLVAAGQAARDDSYTESRDFRRRYDDWFVRGHLAMKLIAERLGEDAAWNTHTLLNAVPQRQSFNAGIWLDLEELTGAWANRYDSVWVITGPILVDNYPTTWIGDEADGEAQVAVPEALFKIVVKESADPDSPDVLAFVYPQVGPGYLSAPYDHTRYLTSVEEIETLTGLSFLNVVPEPARQAVVKSSASGLWPVAQSNFVRACRN